MDCCSWADAADSFQIFVRTLTGKTLVILVESTDPIADAKATISDKRCVPAHLFRLIFAGRQLDRGFVVSYGLRSESTLHVVSRLRGGVSLGEMSHAVEVARREELPDGKCLVCSIKDRRDRWCDAFHFGTSAHSRAFNWASRQVDAGSLNRAPGCTPCTAASSDPVSGSVTVFRPSGHSPATPVDGAFLVDSCRPLFRQGVGARWGDGSTSRALGNREAPRLAELPP